MANVFHSCPNNKFNNCSKVTCRLIRSQCCEKSGFLSTATWQLVEQTLLLYIMSGDIATLSPITRNSDLVHDELGNP